jgi:hypothetical protein
LVLRGYPPISAFSEIQVLLPHRHSNMWKIRPAEALGMLVMNAGCSAHFRQRGEVGAGRSRVSMVAQNTRKTLRAS